MSCKNKCVGQIFDTLLCTRLDLSLATQQQDVFFSHICGVKASSIQVLLLQISQTSIFLSSSLFVLNSYAAVFIFIAHEETNSY